MGRTAWLDPSLPYTVWVRLNGECFRYAARSSLGANCRKTSSRRTAAQKVRILSVDLPSFVHRIAEVPVPYNSRYKPRRPISMIPARTAARAALLAVPMTSMALLQPAIAAPFDGSWTVIRTGIGCTPKREISVRFKRGKASGSYRGGTGWHRISGSISPRGSFKFTAKSGSDTVVFQGRVKGRSGTGSWYVSGRSCRGDLTISR